MNNTGLMCFAFGFMHRCYFVRHQDMDRMKQDISRFFLTQEQASLPHDLVVSNITSLINKVKTTGLQQMIENTYLVFICILMVKVAHTDKYT